MNKTKLLLVAILALCLVQIDKVTVPERDPIHKDLKFVKYDAERRVFVDYGMGEETWCKSASSWEWLCRKPDHIPAKDKLFFSLREDLFTEEKWQYLAAGTIYIEQTRRPSRQKDESGKTRYVFDCKALPFVPPGMEIVMHSGERFEWSPQRVKLYSPQHGHSDELVRGYDFLKELAGQKTLNGTALEYLISSPFLIPREWCGRQVLFPGTIYGDCAQMHYSSILFHDGRRWMASIHRLDYELYASSIAAAVLT
jgi:hypothetical protein